MRKPFVIICIMILARDPSAQSGSGLSRTMLKIGEKVHMFFIIRSEPVVTFNSSPATIPGTQSSGVFTFQALH